MTVSCHPVWNTRSRDEAMVTMTALMGARGENLLPPNGPVFADPPDMALARTPEFLSWWTRGVPDWFAHGVDGYVDDRLADGVGWGSFEVSNITCPVVVLHGSVDGFVPLATARYTAAIVPGATLRIVEGRGHLTILPETVGVMSGLLAQCAVTS